MPWSKQEAKIFTRADAIVREIMKLDYRGLKDIDAEIASRLLDIIDGDYDAWHMIDEKTGRWPDFYRNKFYMVRQLRNHPVFGPNLFNSFKNKG